MARVVVKPIRDKSRWSGKQLRLIVRIVNRFRSDTNFLMAARFMVQPGILTAPVARSARFAVDGVIAAIARIYPVRQNAISFRLIQVAHLEHEAGWTFSTRFVQFAGFSAKALFATSAGNSFHTFFANRAGNTTAGVTEFPIRCVSKLSLANVTVNARSSVAAISTKRSRSDAAFRIAEATSFFTASAQKRTHTLRAMLQSIAISWQACRNVCMTCHNSTLPNNRGVTFP